MEWNKMAFLDNSTALVVGRGNGRWLLNGSLTLEELRHLTILLDDIKQQIIQGMDENRWN